MRALGGTLVLIILMGCGAAASLTTPVPQESASRTASGIREASPEVTVSVQLPETPLPTVTPMPAPTVTDTSHLTPEIAALALKDNGTDAGFADVIEVKVSGDSGAYGFAVTVRSPDTGCGQFADWWEVLSEGGDLLYRRILLHSHVGEQPFTRSGGSVNIRPDAVVIVRAHMNAAGYGGLVLQGQPSGSFQRVDLPADFAADLDNQGPLPTSCAF